MAVVIPTIAQLTEIYPERNGKPYYYVESLRNLLQVISSTEGGVSFIVENEINTHTSKNPSQVLKTICDGWSRYGACSGSEYTGTMLDAQYILHHGFEAFKAIRNC
jgi:hypothetical protein